MNSTPDESSEKIQLVCNCGDCEFMADVKGLDLLTLEEAILLENWIKPEFIPTREEDDLLHLLIQGQMVCPIHGKKDLTYAITLPFSDSAVFELDIEDGPADENSAGVLIGFLDSFESIFIISSDGMLEIPEDGEETLRRLPFDPTILDEDLPPSSEG